MVADNLNKLAQRQRELLAELEQEAKLLGEMDMAKDKQLLETQLKKITEEFAVAKKKLGELDNENAGLKSRLYEQAYNEKVNILGSAEQKMEIYFRSVMAGERNELLKFEAIVMARIASIKKALQANRLEGQAEITQKLEEATDILEKKLAGANFNQTAGLYSATEEEELKRLREAQITDEQMKQLAKKNNIESLVGLNLLNKLGLLLVVIGVIAASRYTYTFLPDILKGIMMFVLGGAMLVGGELLNRKKANVFSLGVTAGGVAVLYIALSVSFFGLKIVSTYPAFVLCILITAAAFLLSTRYKSQTILAFALLGGYLPIFSIGGSSILLYAAIVYFITLNLLALSTSFGRKWVAVSFVGLGLNMVGTAYICLNFYGNSTATGQIAAVCYVAFAFVVYTLIPVLGTYKEKTTFKPADILLIAINTVFSSAMMYWLFYGFGLESYDGVLTIFFAVVYILLGRFIDSKLPQENNMRGLFYLTAFAFVVLTVPLQLGVTWLSMGWLVEGIALLIFGVLGKEKLFKRAGLVISALCLASFIFFDVIGFWGTLFAYKYFAITLGSVLVLAALIYKGEVHTQVQRLYKYATVVNLWLYTQFVVLHSVGGLLATNLEGSALNSLYLVTALAIVVTFLFAYITPRFKPLAGNAIKVICLFLYAVGILRLLLLHLSASLYLGGITQTTATTVVGTITLIGISLLSLIALNDIVRYFVLEQGLSVSYYPLIISGYFVALLTQMLICQYGLHFSSAIISVIYVITALAWIVWGFMKHFSFLRRFGLGLAILAVVKLFLVDLYTLTQGYKIVSYFTLGIVLLGISFVYQHFSKKLEANGEAVINVKEDS